MNVNLGETFDQFVAKMLGSGLYQSQSEVVREGLRLLKEREDLKDMRLAQLREEINKGLRDIDRGNFETLDEASLKDRFEQSKARGRRALKGRKA